MHKSIFVTDKHTNEQKNKAILEVGCVLEKLCSKAIPLVFSVEKSTPAWKKVADMLLALYELCTGHSAHIKKHQKTERKTLKRKLTLHQGWWQRWWRWLGHQQRTRRREPSSEHGAVVWKSKLGFSSQQLFKNGQHSEIWSSTVIGWINSSKGIHGCGYWSNMFHVLGCVSCFCR